MAIFSVIISVMSLLLILDIGLTRKYQTENSLPGQSVEGILEQVNAEFHSITLFPGLTALFSLLTFVLCLVYIDRQRKSQWPAPASRLTSLQQWSFLFKVCTRGQSPHYLPK